MWLLGTIGVACGPLAPEPEITSVTPERGWRGEPTAVVIAGENLLPSITLGAETEVGGVWEAWLDSPTGALSLEGTTLVDYSHVSALVPAGLESGEYPLVVRTPSGREARLEGGYRVAETMADRLEVSLTDAAYDLGEYATLTVQVLDPSGEVLPADLRVSVQATSRLEAGGVEFAADQLIDQVPLKEGVGILGSLDPDGTTRVLVRSTIADDITFVVTAVDDDGLDPGEVLVSWNTGELAAIEVTFPFSPFRITAGEPFAVHLALLDEFGNGLPDTAARISISDATECSGFRSVEDVIGEATIELTLDRACTDRLLIFNSNVEVESEPFEVLAAEMAGYALVAAPDSDIEAGSQPVIVAVDAIDEFGNTVPDFAGEVQLSDSLGGLDINRTTCSSLESGMGLCTIYLLRAGTDQIHVRDEELRRGSSNAVEVIAVEPAVVSISLAGLETVAGNELGAVVALMDIWNNLVTFDPAGADPVNFSDDSGSADCRWAGAVADGRQSFDCTFTRAWTGSSVTATLPSLGLSGSSPEPLTIHNAELASVSLVAPTSIVAGRPFTLSLAGFDEFDNPYVRQTDPTLTLEDTSGTLSTGSATLDAAGQASVSESITTAGTGRIQASQAGTVLGVSGVLEVSATTMAGFSVDAPSWAAVGDSASIAVTAVDAYGNEVSSYSGSPVVSVTSDACDPAVTSAGTSIEINCSAVRLNAQVSATDGAYSGVSAVMDVVDFDCASPPVVSLLVDGESQPVLCLASGEAAALVDASASAAGGAALAVYAFEDDDGARDRGTTGLASFAWSTAGSRAVEALVADVDGCAATDSTWVWVGNDDGEPAGPVVVSASASSVASGASVTVTLAARDCTGDVAAGQSLLVRANLGEVGGASTGAGLALTLDSVGEATANWTFSAGYAAVATFFSGSPSAGAYGEAQVAVTQDSARPHVLEVEPSGAHTGEVSVVVVRFDEAMLASTLTAATLTGPTGTIATSVFADGATLTLTPVSGLDASSGTFTVSLPSTLRDSAGNRLDGAWSGAEGSFTTTFGAVATTLPSTSGCAIDLAIFHPDGDDSGGEEADFVSLTPVSSAAPAWWRLVVEDSTGESVRDTRFSGGTGTVTWDGLADDGRVVAGGDFLVTLSAIDDAGNAADVCTDSITVEHLLELQ